MESQKFSVGKEKIQVGWEKAGLEAKKKMKKKLSFKQAKNF